MFIIVIFILVLYYWYFVVFEKIPKPIVQGKYVDLKNKLYENGTFLKQLKSDEIFDYDLQQTTKPFNYSINLEQNTMNFTVQNKNWSFPLLSEYFWNGEEIFTRDVCFGKGNVKIKASNKQLFDFINDNPHLKMSALTTDNNSDMIFETFDVYYFECNKDKIQKLGVCPPGFIFRNNNCENLDICINQNDNYTYSDIQDSKMYFECRNGKSIKKSCPRDEIFEYDKCKVPNEICKVKPNGYLFKIDRVTIGMCRNKKTEIRHCPKDMYVLNNKCEHDVCENLHNKVVSFPKMLQYPFEYYTSYGKCYNGKLTNITKCPEKWDYFNTRIDVTQLPKVFNGNSCEQPKLCENVTLVDQDIVIPSYEYRNALSTWDKAEFYDRLIGYKCNSNNELQEVSIENGSFINDFKIINACNKNISKVPTKHANIYFNCNTNTSETCLSNEFFNGSECVNRIPNAFTFKGLDIFKFNELHENNWVKHRLLIHQLHDKPQCNPDEELLPIINICAHKECVTYASIIRELKRPIKLDNEFQCIWDESKIKKVKYDKPFNDVYLNFWTQSFTTDTTIQQVCTEGLNIQTGNFVLDSTLYTTCKFHQPFVFCPSSSTLSINKVHTNTYACAPKHEVFTYKLPANKTIEIFIKEINKITLPKGTSYKVDQNSIVITQDETILTIDDLKQYPKNNFIFQANQEVTIDYYILSNNPPNTYFKNKILKRLTNPYDILHDDTTTEKDQLHYHNYTIKSNLENFLY